MSRDGRFLLLVRQTRAAARPIIVDTLTIGCRRHEAPHHGGSAACRQPCGPGTDNVWDAAWRHDETPHGHVDGKKDVINFRNLSQTECHGLTAVRGHDLELNGVSRRRGHQDTPARLPPVPPTPDDVRIDAHIDRFAR